MANLRAPAGLTATQHRFRAKHIGASEVPAMMGMNEYVGPVDLWMQKTGRVPRDKTSSEAADIGHMIEPGLIGWAARTLKVDVTRRNAFRVHSEGILSATFDALVTTRGRREGMNAKTSGIVNPAAVDETWGEEFTGQVPDYTALQAQAEMAVGNLDRVWIPALLAYRGRCLFVVERDEVIIAEIIATARVMKQAIDNDTRPAGEIVNRNVLNRIRRKPGKQVEIDNDVMARWYDLDQAARKVIAEREQAMNAIIERLGDAEIGLSPIGRFRYVKQTQNRIDIQRVRAEFPKVASKCGKTIEVFRHYFTPEKAKIKRKPRIIPPKQIIDAKTTAIVKQAAMHFGAKTRKPATVITPTAGGRRKVMAKRGTR